MFIKLIPNRRPEKLIFRIINLAIISDEKKKAQDKFVLVPHWRPSPHNTIIAMVKKEFVDLEGEW